MDYQVNRCLNCCPARWRAHCNYKPRLASSNLLGYEAPTICWPISRAVWLLPRKLCSIRPWLSRWTSPRRSGWARPCSSYGDRLHRPELLPWWPRWTLYHQHADQRRCPFPDPIRTKKNPCRWRGFSHPSDNVVVICLIRVRRGQQEVILPGESSIGHQAFHLLPVQRLLVRRRGRALWNRLTGAGLPSVGQIIAVC